MSNQKLQTSVQYLKGVGPALAKILGRLKIVTVEDLLYFLPRTFEDRAHPKPIGQLAPAGNEIVKGEVCRVEAQMTRTRFSILKVLLRDPTGMIQAVWFNQPFLHRVFHAGMKLIIAGKVEYSQFDRKLQLLAREYEIDTGDNPKIIPRYPLTEGVFLKKLRAIIKTAIDGYLPFVAGEKTRRAIKALHLPEDIAKTRAARDYLSYQELFAFQLGILLAKKQFKEDLRGSRIIFDEKGFLSLKSKLPFALTKAQESALADVCADLQSGRPMNRLLQGDVGSGKTIVAAIAAYFAFCGGFQAIILVPTEILALQHFDKLKNLFQPLKIKLGFLSASMASDKVRKEAGLCDLIIGTHALLEEKVKFKNLGLVVIDEQHRFGVEQRASLIKKGVCPHVLIMTATPIPRSLALTLYGELDRSVIDELPPGRMPVKTYYIPEDKRWGAYKFIRTKLKAGRQVFVVCPLIEESLEHDLRAAKEEAARLRKEIFPEYKVGLMHGRLKGREKDKIMKDFAKGKIKILVSTTVVEVGIDVQNATVMVIEHAERFGLSQLHQLRGRIGRGENESFCFLIGEPKSQDSKARIKAMLESSDGFKIAEADLRLRGPGDFYGVRQSGLPNFRVADIIRDEKILIKARKDAEDLIERDPEGARNRWEIQREALKNSKRGWEDTTLN